ncbi:MAG: hypothetical protein EAY72_00440 [Bacteroidetes bacterium]|nr:MAG: hypothetical protein EAY72_00440 [Bacteroidota bacterium]TAE72486.1 MAG: hypothetical protein EAY68_01140 [Bacteroidota bacterium]
MYKALFVLSICCGWACNTNTTDNSLADILNEHFLTMVDTAAYQTGHLLQTPGVVGAPKYFSKIGVRVNQQVVQEHRLVASAQQVAKQRQWEGFEHVWQQQKPIVNIPWGAVNKVGKFQLLWNSTKASTDEAVIAGTLDINYFAASAKRAIVIFTVIDRNGKGGVSTVYFLQQTASTWKLLYSEDLEFM